MSAGSRRARKRASRGAIAFRLFVIVGLLAALSFASLAAYQSGHPPARQTGAAAASATPAASGASAISLAQSTQQQATLVTREDARLAVVESAVTPARYAYSDQKTPYLITGTGTDPTLVLTPSQARYTTADLLKLAPTAFTALGGGTFLLSENIAVSPGVTLALDSADVETLRLASGSAGIATIVSMGGALQLSGTAARPLTITSWDTAAQSVDANVADGRAYIRAVGGSISLSHVTASDLGFWSGRTGGVALTGTNNDMQNSFVSGSILDSSITGDAYGLFVTSAQNVQVARSTVSDSLLDGVLLHRSVTGVSVANTTSQDNGGSGFVADRGVNGATFTSVRAIGNGKDGILLDGRPLADGPSASGAAAGGTGEHTVADSTVKANAAVGINVIGADGVTLLRNSIESNDTGIVVRAGAAGATIADNTLRTEKGFGIYLRDGVTGATLSGNSVSDGTTAIFLRDSVALVRDNTVSRASGHGVSLVGAVQGTQLRDNVLGGRGTSAIDDRRAAGHTDQSGNDSSGWRPPSLAYAVVHWVLHPLRELWLAILLILLATAIYGRRRRGRSTHPYAKQARMAAAAASLAPHLRDTLPRRTAPAAPQLASAGAGPAGSPSINGHGNGTQ
jgi:parallel beta-helix repeat protein